MGNRSPTHQATTPAHGGKRAGSGRKTVTVGKARTYRFPIHVDNWLAKQKNMTATITDALETKMREDGAL